MARDGYAACGCGSHGRPSSVAGRQRPDRRAARALDGRARGRVARGGPVRSPSCARRRGRHGAPRRARGRRPERSAMAPRGHQRRRHRRRRRRSTRASTWGPTPPASCTSSTAGALSAAAGRGRRRGRVGRRQARPGPRRCRVRSETTRTSSRSTWPRATTPVLLALHRIRAGADLSRARARRPARASGRLLVAASGHERGRRPVARGADVLRSASTGAWARPATRLPLTVRFPGGAPRGVPLDVRARLVRASPRPTRPPLPSSTWTPATCRSTIAPYVSCVVRLPRVAGDEVEDGDWTVHVEVAGRSLDLPFHPRRAVRVAAARADRAIHDAQSVPMSAGTLESVEHLRDRLVDFVAQGRRRPRRRRTTTRASSTSSPASLEAQQDPYVGRAGARARCAARTGRRWTASSPSSRSTCRPTSTRTATYPLIVALHGMNGRPLEMIMWLFGYDDPDRDGNWEDRHPRRDLPPLEAIVVAPDGHFNAMYRDIGEDDVMRVIDWAMAHLPDRPRARDDHRPVDGRHRDRGVRPAQPGPLRGGRAAVRLPQLLRSQRHRRARAAPLGEVHRRAALERLLGRERDVPAALRRARHQGPARGEQRRPHRSLHGAQLRREPRAPRPRTQRLADDLRGPQGRPLAADPPPPDAPARAAVQDAEHALGRRRVAPRARARVERRVGRGRSRASTAGARSRPRLTA